MAYGINRWRRIGDCPYCIISLCRNRGIRVPAGYERGSAKAGYTQSVMCDTFTEHTLVKFKITGRTHGIVINMIYNTTESYYGPCRINILHVQLLILSLTNVCSVKMSHMTDSVDSA